MQPSERIDPDSPAMPWDFANAGARDYPINEFDPPEKGRQEATAPGGISRHILNQPETTNKEDGDK